MRINFRGAVFDADGTLLASMSVWHSLGELYLRSRNIEPEEGLSARLWPLSYEQGCEYLRSHYALPESVSEIQQGISRMIEAFYRNDVQLKPGVREFLARLQREGVPMVIATSGDRELLQAALTRNGIAGYFGRIFTCTELHTDKRHPEIFRACADSLGLPPANVAVFEDVLHAIETAKSAGFITVGVEDSESFHDKGRIMRTADYYVTDWRYIDEDSINDSGQR